MSCNNDCYEALPCLPTCNCDSNDIIYKGPTDVCVGTVNGTSLTETLNQLRIFAKTRLHSVTSNSLVVSTLPSTCNKISRVEVVPSTDAGNIFTLGTDGHPYVAPSGVGAICVSLPGIFSTNVGQNNTVSTTTYNLMALNASATGCQAISIAPPTGFAVTGNIRKSAFGKMEFYPTLTAANTAATTGETVLIYTDTVENLIAKNGIHYQGIGMHSIGDFTSTVVLPITLSNLTISGLSLTNANITTNNVKVIGTSGIQNGAWSGGTFLDNTKTINIFGNARVSNIYSEQNIIVSEEGKLDKFAVYYTGAASKAVNIQCTIAGYSVVTNGVVNTLASDGLYVLADTINLTLNNIVATSTTGRGAYIQCGGPNNNTILTASNIIGRSDSNYGLHATGNGEPLVNPVPLNTGFILTNSVGISNTGAGITGFNANFKFCNAYSNTGVGMSIQGAEQSGRNLYVIECIAESKANYGAQFTRDVYISGGTFISRLDTSAGNPIVIQDGRLLGQNFFIAGVKTIAVNASAYAIKGLNTVSARISGCNFLNENVAIGVLGIDPSITLIATTIDAYGNIK